MEVWAVCSTNFGSWSFYYFVHKSDGSILGGFPIQPPIVEWTNGLWETQERTHRANRWLLVQMLFVFSCSKIQKFMLSLWHPPPHRISSVNNPFPVGSGTARFFPAYKVHTSLVWRFVNAYLIVVSLKSHKCARKKQIVVCLAGKTKKLFTCQSRIGTYIYTGLEK
jgi:hypothetical protein